MLYFSAAGLCSALGTGIGETARNLRRGRAPGMRTSDRWWQAGEAVYGTVDAALVPIPPALAAHDSRNNRLLLTALAQIRPAVDAAIAGLGADRIAVVLGTSTSGADEADRYASHVIGQSADPAIEATYHYEQQEMGDPARFLGAYLGLRGPTYTIATACSSSARAIISGRRLIESGLADAALVGGADTLGRLPVNGFASLGLLSPTRCQPFSRDRNGITIGEGAALLLLTREPQAVALLGSGESSDAWHMTAPHPEGAGAIQAMTRALGDAHLHAEDIGYINLHGTGTPANDRVEALAVQHVFGNRTPCSSVKHLMGHTLGAAGACEAALCWMILTRGLDLPPQVFEDAVPDDDLPDFGLLRAPARLRKPVIMSNAFAFGGNNTSLILGIPSAPDAGLANTP